MSARQLLLDIQSSGGELRVEGGELRAKYLTPDHRAAVRAHKDELVALLAPPDAPLALLEFGRLPVAHLGQLPAATTVTARLQGHGAPVYVTNDRDRYQKGVTALEAVWSPVEAEELALAVEAGKAFAEDFAEWCHRKETLRGWRLTRLEALRGVAPEPRDSDVWWGGNEWCAGHWAKHGPTFGMLFDHLKVWPERLVCGTVEVTLAVPEAWRGTDEPDEVPF